MTCARLRRGLLVGVLIGGLVGPLVMTPARADTPRELLTQASKARAAGDLEGALRLLLLAYEMEAAPVLLNNVARIYEELGRYGDAFAAYKTVLDDPKAPENLRAMDAARMAILGPKLGKAWVRPQLEPLGARLWVDGRVPPGAPGTEISVSHGAHLYQGLTRGGDVAWMAEIDLPIDRRSDLDISLLAPDAMATVNLDGHGAELQALQVDGHPVQGDVTLLRRLHLSPGDHTLRLDRGPAGVTTRSGTLQGGSTISVSALPLLTPGESVPVATDNTLDVATAEASGPRTRSPWPVITASIGAIGAGVGATLLASAAADRQTPEQNDAGFVIGLTQAEDGERWAQANDKARQGAVALGVGGAMVVGGLVWWLMDGEPEDAVTIAPGVGGLMVGGRF